MEKTYKANKANLQDDPNVKKVLEITDGIMQRIGIPPKMPPRIRIGATVYDQVYKGLCAMEYTYTGENGETCYMWFRWTNPQLHTPHFLLQNVPVQLDLDLAPDTIVFDTN